MEDLKKSLYIRGGNVVGALGDKNFSTAPLGTVLSFAGQTAPHGYLLCDGASYKVADYPHLYAVIGNTYGGDSTNFNVPNLVDKFIQGSTTSGTEKEAGLPNIEGEWLASSVYTPYFEGTLTGAFSAEGSQKARKWGSNEGNGQNTLIFDASKSNSIYGNSDTVQPPALTMVYIIKAFHTNEGVDSTNEVSDPIIEYVEGELATKKDIAKLLNNATDSTKWIKLKLGNSSTFQPIIISDQYGGKIEITGMANDGTYKTVKLVRYSYGDWTTHSATDFTLYNGVDPNYKIRRLYYYPTDGYYYLEIKQWATIKIEGNSTAEIVASLPAETSEMTLIPESNWGRISDSETSENSTWSSSKIASEIGRTQIPSVGTSTGWKAEKDLSSLPIGTYRLTSMHSSSGSVIDALILKTGYSYFLKTILKEGSDITVGISGDTLTVAESTTAIGVISVFLNTVGINA